MRNAITVITVLCLILPVLVLSLTAGIVYTKSFDYIDIQKTIDYYDLITNNKNKANESDMDYIDEKLDAELARHRYTSMSFEAAKAVLREINETEHTQLDILLGNGELVYKDNRKFFVAYVIIMPEQTYLFACYRSQEPIREDYTMYVMQDGTLHAEDFSYLEQSDSDVLSLLKNHAKQGVFNFFVKHNWIVIISVVVFVLGTISAYQEISAHRKKD